MNNRELMGKPVSGLDTPALLLDRDALQANIDLMAAFFQGKPSGLRPHFKSHKCTRIAKLQMQAGAVGITCAKLGEAEVLVDAGIDKVLIANQIVGEHKLPRLMEIARRANVIVAVDSPGNIKDISDAADEAGVSVGVLVEVDIGMNRCGVAIGQPALELAKLVDSLPGLRFEGLQGYEGHLVLLRDEAERADKTRAALADLVATRTLIENSGLKVNIVSGGGTGTYTVTGDFPGVDEVQAGSYATMDWWYGEIRPEFKQAISILTKIVSRPKPGMAIVDVGTKGIGAEFGSPTVKNIPGASVGRFGSEEHTVMSAPDDALGVGDNMELIPSHGCTTCNLYREFVVHRDGIVVDIWPIEGSGKLQ